MSYPPQPAPQQPAQPPMPTLSVTPPPPPKKKAWWPYCLGIGNSLRMLVSLVESGNSIIQKIPAPAARHQSDSGLTLFRSCRELSVCLLLAHHVNPDLLRVAYHAGNVIHFRCAVQHGPVLRPVRPDKTLAPGDLVNIRLHVLEVGVGPIPPV